MTEKVLYRWQVQPELQQRFHAAWAELTDIIQQQPGAEGSTLFTTEDGDLCAIAGWQSRAARDAAFAALQGHGRAQALAKQMQQFAQHRYPELWLQAFVAPA